MEVVSNAYRMVPKFPIPRRRNILITKALPYVNNVPHLGNIIGNVLRADAFARYIRLRGYNATYICGTDEYGTTTETKAIEEKCSPKEICDEYRAIHREVYKWSDISSDEFGPTSIPQQTEVCQAILKKPLENDWLSENTMQLLFGDTCKSFLADHAVEGSCPTPGCDYDIACGYQCEKCGKILNPTELKDPRCKLICPDTLLGTGEDWIVMKTISVMEYLKYEAGKFSKGKGIGVLGNNAKETNITMEAWRYFLLTNGPEVSDTLFTRADLQAKLNSELHNNLGNFINRVLSFIAKPPGQGYDYTIPDAPHDISDPLTKNLAEKVGKYVEQYVEAMEKVELPQGLEIAMCISSEGNAYLQESQFWKLFEEDKPRCAIVMKTSLGLVHILACLLEPFMPSFSLEVLKQLNLPPGQLSLADEKGYVDGAKRPWLIVSSGHRIGKPELLFKELKDGEVRFAGSQVDRIESAVAEAEKGTGQLKKAKVSDNSGKKQKSTKSENSTKPATEPEISIGVGLITKAQKHPDANALNVEEDDVDELPAPLPSVHEGLSGSNPSLFGKESVHSGKGKDINLLLGMKPHPRSPQTTSPSDASSSPGDENDSPLADLSNLPLYSGSSTPESLQFKGIVDLVTSPGDEVGRTEPQPSLRAPGSGQPLSGGPEIGACEAVRPTGKTLKALRRAKLHGPVREGGPVPGARKDLDAIRCAKLPGPGRKGGAGGKGKDINLVLGMKPDPLSPQTTSPSDASSSPGDVEFERVNEQWIYGDDGDRVRVTWYNCSRDGCPVKKRRLTVYEADALSNKSTVIYRGTHEH